MALFGKESVFKDFEKFISKTFPQDRYDWRKGRKWVFNDGSENFIACIYVSDHLEATEAENAWWNDKGYPLVKKYNESILPNRGNLPFHHMNYYNQFQLEDKDLGWVIGTFYKKFHSLDEKNVVELGKEFEKIRMEYSRERYKIIEEICNHAINGMPPLEEWVEKEYTYKAYRYKRPDWENKVLVDQTQTYGGLIHHCMFQPTLYKVLPYLPLVDRKEAELAINTFLEEYFSWDYELSRTLEKRKEETSQQ